MALHGRPAHSMLLMRVRANHYSFAMSSARRPAADLDSPWKEALEHFLSQFLAFFYPAVHADLDWARGYESLDKELQGIMPSARTGKRLADKLFKIWRQNGRE